MRWRGGYDELYNSHSSVTTGSCAKRVVVEKIFQGRKRCHRKKLRPETCSRTRAFPRRIRGLLWAVTKRCCVLVEQRRNRSCLQGCFKQDLTKDETWRLQKICRTRELSRKETVSEDKVRYTKKIKAWRHQSGHQLTLNEKKQRKASLRRKHGDFLEARPFKD